MSAIKQAENSFAALRKKMTDKSRFGLGLNQQGRVFDKKLMIPLGLAGYKMIITNLACYLSRHIQCTLIE